MNKEPVSTNPAESELAIIKLQSRWRTSLPFVVAGALMILGSVISAYLAFNLLTNYRTSLINGRFVSTDYASLYVGLLNVVTFGLDLFAALLLLLKKYIVLIEGLASLVLACGLSAQWIFTYFHSPLIYMYWGQFLLQGLFVALPMIAFSLITLIIVRLNRKQFKQNINVRWNTFPFTVSGALIIIASVPFAYNGLSLLSYLLSIAYKSANYGGYFYPAIVVVLLNLLVFGVDLFVALLLLKRTHVGLAAVIIGTMLTVGLPLQLIANEPLPSPGLPFDFPTVACAIATLILIGLNYRTLKQDFYINTNRII